MQPEEIDLWTSPGFVKEVEENLGRDPLAIALDRSLAHPREVASRVRTLAKARAKLPSYFEARCLLTDRAYQQSSGERAALSKTYGGRLCIDLTCGLGVDSFALSRGFENVISLEPDPVVARVARYNFGLLGVGNVEVVQARAEDFIASYNGPSPDLIYVDPDRRDAGGRRYAALADCSPDVLSLLPRLRSLAAKVVVKLSPLFDVHEAVRVFGPRVRVVVISEAGECKEVLVETYGAGEDGSLGSLGSAEADGAGCASVVARMLERDGSRELEFGYPVDTPDAVGQPGVGDIRWLVVPDVALVKVGAARSYYSSRGFYMTSATGYAFAGGDVLPGDGELAGRVFRVRAAEKYAPRKLKGLLKSEGITRLNIMLRDYPDGVAVICKQLGIKEGGSRWAAFTMFGGERYCFMLETSGF